MDLLAPLILAGVFTWDQYQSLLFYYADPGLDGFGGGLDKRGASNLEELSSVLRSVMIRRTYADFGFRMPWPQFRNEPAALGREADAYRAAAADFAAWYRSARGRKAPPLARFVTLRRLAEFAKAPAAAAAVKADLAAGAKVLTFCEFRETAEHLQKQFKGSGLVIGGDTAGGRADNIEVLQADGAAAVFATTGALDAALNLQSVDRVNYVSLGWDPSTFTQTAGRAWRQGRRDPVFIRRHYIEGDALENYLLDVLAEKEETLKTLGLLPTLSTGALVNA